MDEVTPLSAKSSNDLSCYDIVMKTQEDRLHYYVTGKRSVERAYQLWKRIYDDCLHYGIYKVHAVVVLEGMIDKMQIPLLINRLVKLNDSKPITCSWVDLNDSSYLDNLIGEKIPRPECMNIRIFNNEQEALEWLDKQ